MKTSISLTLMLLVFALAGISQDVLTLDQVLKKALENNFQIKILENTQEIAENSATIGNAGLLPSVSLNAQLSGNVSNTNLEFASPAQPPIDVTGAQSVTTTAGATVNYTLFKGFSGKYTYDKLKLTSESVKMQSQAAIEATMLQVANAYYVLSRANDQITIAENNVAITKERYERAKLANEFGTALRTELLRARVDMTTDSSNLLLAEVNVENAKRSLEQLVGAELGDDFEPAPFETEINDWTLASLYTEAKANNATIKNRQLQAALAEKDYKIAWSSVFPTVSLSGGYNYNSQENEAGFILVNTTAGFNGAVALSYPLFNGFKSQIQRQNQKVTMETRQLELAEEEMQLATDLANTWASYRQSIKALSFEKANQASAELNLARSEELFKSGNISSTQFREAQIALTATQVRISNAQVSVKLNELELMRLSGQILSK
jgi:outer membrane protein